MNSKILKRIVFIGLLFFIKTIVIAQVPVDNPYAVKYNRVNHWTDSLKWENISNAEKIEGLIDDKGVVDSTILLTTIKDISNKGGGVLYFPKGKYYFNYNVELFSGVILRGADIEDNKTAKEDYKPATQFIFPKYFPSFTGKGTPYSTAFRVIHAGWTEKNNFGLINIDINRGRISFAGQRHNNVIVYGIRSNNAAAGYRPYHGGDQDHEWELFPDENNSNIGIQTKNNALVANCRINDAITDDFNMPNFMTNDGYVFTKDTVKFEHGTQAGIYMQEGEESNKGNKIEILDNYVASGKPSIYKINLRGKNGVMNNNVLVDIPLQNFIDQNGFYARKLQDSVANLFEKHLFVKNGKDTLVYRLLKPHNYDPKKKYPLVLFFHGIGETGVNKNPLVHFVQTFTKPEIFTKHPCFVLVPHLVRANDRFSGKEGNVNAPPQASLQMSIEVVNKLKKEYAIDKKKMFVTGLSTGGHAVVETLLRYPKLFNNAVLMSYLFPLTDAQYKAVNKVSFFLAIGKKDADIPVEYMRLLAENLRKAKAEVNYYEYDISHFSWLPLTHDPKFIKDLFDKM